MTLPDRDGTTDWIGRTVVDRDGADIGVCRSLLADTATGRPEWMYVDRDEATLIVPMLEAEEKGGRVHVTVTRAHADGAPRFEPTPELSRAQEAALYRHYGIEYSTDTWETLLPAEADQTDAEPAEAEPTGSAPQAAAGELSGAGSRNSAVAAAMAGL